MRELKSRYTFFTRRDRLMYTGRCLQTALAGQTLEDNTARHQVGQLYLDAAKEATQEWLTDIQEKVQQLDRLTQGTDSYTSAVYEIPEAQRHHYKTEARSHLEKLRVEAQQPSIYDNTQAGGYHLSDEIPEPPEEWHFLIHHEQLVMIGTEFDANVYQWLRPLHGRLDITRNLEKGTIRVKEGNGNMIAAASTAT